jgi:hypothetical protein
MYIRCSCYMFRPHMGHHQATLIIGETIALYIFSLVPSGTSLLLLLLLICFVGYFQTIFFSTKTQLSERHTKKEH